MQPRAAPAIAGHAGNASATEHKGILNKFKLLADWRGHVRRMLCFNAAMRLSYFLAGVSVLVAFGFLGFRILDLEQRLAVLTQRSDEDERQAHASEPRKVAIDTAVPSKDYETRLRTIEQRIAMLESLKQALPMPNSALGEGRLKQEEAILSVMERENSRVREVQLEWHKARWLETRKQQLAGFAYQQNLEPAQTTRLYEALERELDGLADVMKRPSFAEEPDQVASDWLKILGDTDHQAQEALSPAQYQAWSQGRLFERKVLWPWLPDDQNQTAKN
jgi:hypothetical protein